MRYNLNNVECKIYYETNKEFETVRKQCLAEDNWLKHNYTQENLKIEDHSGYAVIYEKSTGKPMIMGGVFNDGRFPSNIARHLNRLYTFPEFRTKPTDYLEGWKIVNILLQELYRVNTYEAYIITMQNRPGRPGKVFWKYWKKGLDTIDTWNQPEGYIQTCPWMVQKCWQNFVWKEFRTGAFKEWNPTILTHEEWERMEEGK